VIKGIFLIWLAKSFMAMMVNVIYGAMGHALQYMSERVAEGEAIGFPYNMGCDRAGGDWGIVLEMIEFYFKDHQVKIYRLGK
jgi:hypothetical protein